MSPQGLPERPIVRSKARRRARRRWFGRWLGDRRLQTGVLAAGAGGLALIAVLEVLSRSGALDVHAWRGGMGVVLAVSAAALFVGSLLRPRDPADFVRRTLGGSGLLLLALWVIPSLAGVAVQPRLLFDAFLAVGLACVTAAIVGWVLPNSLAVWLLEFIASLLLWLATAVSALGLFFDPVGAPRLVYLALMVGWVLIATRAVYVLVREARDPSRGNPLAKHQFSDITLTAVLGGLLAGYGLWYAWVVGPTDVPPSVNAQVAMLPAALSSVDLGGATREDVALTRNAVKVSFTVRNTSDSRVAILGDIYNIYSVDPAVEKDRGEAGNVRSYHCKARRDLGRNEGISCVGPDDSMRDGPVNVSRGFGADQTALDVGRIWQPGEWLEPGSESVVSLVVLPPADAQYLRAELWVVFARSDRLVLAPRDDYVNEEGVPTLASQCSANHWPSTRYRRLAGDPLSGLIAAYAPARFEVVWRPEQVPVPELVGTSVDDVDVELNAVGLTKGCAEGSQCACGDGEECLFVADQKLATPPIAWPSGMWLAMAAPGSEVILTTTEEQPEKPLTGRAGRPAPWELWLCDWQGSSFRRLQSDLSIGKSDAADSGVAFAIAADELFLASPS
jgi:hypothetical protein